jgi:SNF2 family DNA or RNA helicase
MADDMGLGKTVQVIAFLLKLKGDGDLSSPALVVCPTTIVGNWEKECRRFAPSLNVSIYHGSERSLTIKNKDVVITTYGTLRRDIDKFSQREWRAVVVDEAQNIKNPDTDQARAIKSLKTPTRIAMSGTPVENRLAELWSIFDFINRGYLGQAQIFQKKYAVPIEKYRDRDCIERLKTATAPFILRRLKKDKTIIDDLPDKIVSDEYCYLTKEQAALYQRAVDSTMETIEGSGGIQRKGLIFKLITSLKQICNHPAHYAKKGEPRKEQSGKAERVVDLAGKVLSLDQKALVFTQYREMGGLLAALFARELKEEALFFHGGLTRKRRDGMIEEFQEKDSGGIMVISLKAGGTGLNLTSAAHVIHYDLWWNPAVEDQATDRAYRMGQTKNVMVHRLITLGTFEEKIDEMLKSKKELADLTITAGEQWLTELSDRELKDLFSLAG